MKIHALSLIFGVCAACGPTDKSASLESTKNLAGERNVEPQAEKLVAKANELVTNRADTLEIIDGDFVEKAINGALQYKRIIRNRAAFRLSSTFEQNEDDPALQDSVNVFSDGRKNTFKYYMSGDKKVKGAFLLSARIYSSGIFLPKNIKVGINKKYFATIFHKARIPKVVVLSEEEGYQVFTFTFVNEVLVSVEFESNYMG